MLFSMRAFSTVFTVTSNADSGPGTLRDALTQAALADSSVTNYIYFNMADTSQAGRTITLLSQLPDVCSNLTIDGSTQTGSAFGVSDARIALFFETPAQQTLSGLSIVNKHDVAIYGLYLKFLTVIPINSVNYFWAGILLENGKNITIGAAGKGNVMAGFYNALIANPPANEFQYFQNLTLKDNIFGLDADGETQSVNQISPVALTEIVGTVNIGGLPSEGNVFAQGIDMYQENNSNYTDTLLIDYYASATANIEIENNKIGVDYLGENAIAPSSGLTLETEDPGGKNNCTIADNVISASQWYAIYIGNNGLPLYILRNYIGTDKTLTKTFKTGGIFIYGATSAAIGGTSTSDANYITNCNPVSIWPFSNVTVNKNSFYCTVDAQPMHGGNNSSDFEAPFPSINILKYSANSLSGTATPNSSIELFYSDKCGTCSPQTYFASTTADANGNWQYNGNIKGSVIASATLGLNTSDFTQTTINTDSATIINACGNGTGSIKGIIPENAQNVKWVDSTGAIVGTSPDLLNVKLGKYKMVANNGTCADSTSYYQIQNKFQLDTSAIAKTEPSCGNPTGSISGLNIINNDPGAPYLIWQDASGKPLAYSINLSNVTAGNYYLQVKSADSTCSQTFGPFTLKNVTGPNIDQSKAAIQSTSCGQSTGSITGITATGTGTLSYIWWNDQEQTVAITPDLFNQPAGTYKLEVTDQSQCGAVYTTALIITETNGITMNESGATVAPASCNSNNGSVTGIVVTGATSFQWSNATGNIVGTGINLVNAGPGSYVLTASNSSGCSVVSKTYQVNQIPPTQYPVYQVNIYQACTGQTNGGVELLVDSLVKHERWVDGFGQTIGTSIGISQVAAGVYQLYVTDKNGCETLYGTYQVPSIPQLTIQTGNVILTNDHCSLQKGSITGITVSGGRPPYVYAWLDGSGNQISAATALTGLGAGTYSFTVNDATTCGIVSAQFTITDQDIDLPLPHVSNLQVCSPGESILQVGDTQSGYGYRLYDSETGATPIEQQAGGNFIIDVKSTATYYVSQFLGSCESARVAVEVTIGLSSVNIPNAITPNGDGINDYWTIDGIDAYPNAEVQVFTRYGRRVFDSKGYATPFDGTHNGKMLPTGVYYYIINLNTNCNLLSGSLTIIR